MIYKEFEEKFNITLSGQQKEAVQSVDGSVLLLAVPGSGKTSTLVTRLAYMIYVCKINPESILTVTYTVAATNDMRSRFAEKFGEEYSNRLEFRTINGLAQKILQYFARVNEKTVFALADSEGINTIKRVFKNVSGNFATENDTKNIQTAITYAKNMCLTAEEIKSIKWDIEDFYEIYRQYNVSLWSKGLIDYDDQLVYALRILRQYPNVLGYFQNRYRYFCVDEAQDTSKIQNEIIKLLSSGSGNLFMVGDEDQSIYSFRAANPEALIYFKKDYPDGKILFMETNYRSREEIVKRADRLIANNKNRHSKHMTADRQAGGKVNFIKVKSRKGQYGYLLKVMENTDDIQTAILYRNNESALPLIDTLERRNMDYRMRLGDMTFFTHPVVCDICDFINMAVNPNDEESFYRIYYKMGAGITKNIACDVQKNGDYKRYGGILEYISQRDDVSVYTRRKCRSISTHMENMRYDNAGKAVYRIVNYCGYGAYIKERGLDEGKIVILQLLADNESQLINFPKRLEYLQNTVRQKNLSEESDIILSTIHSSKGLEYDRVYLIDMVDGILPSKNSGMGSLTKDEIELLEEERRLYYVAMTRAREELNIFTFNDNETSQFTKEICDVSPIARVSREKNVREQIVYNIDDFGEGILVKHKKFGRGVILKCDSDMADIIFNDEDMPRKISLKVAVTRGVLTPE